MADCPPGLPAPPLPANGAAPPNVGTPPVGAPAEPARPAVLPALPPLTGCPAAPPLPALVSPPHSLPLQGSSPRLNARPEQPPAAASMSPSARAAFGTCVRARERRSIRITVLVRSAGSGQPPVAGFERPANSERSRRLGAAHERTTRSVLPSERQPCQKNFTQPAHDERSKHHVQCRALAPLRCALAAFVFALSLVARASAAEEAIALDYSAPSACPSPAEFQAQVRGFIPAVSVVPRAAAARAFEISIDESGTFGQLRLSSEQGAGWRSAQGADCAEVARLLAFAVALVLDPQLQLQEPPSAAANHFQDAPPLDPGILPRPLPAFLVPLPASPENRAASTAERRARPAKQSLSAVGSVASALSPTASYGVGALYGIAGSWGSLEPQMRVGASYFTSADASRDGATVKFFEVLGAVEGCPTAFEVVGIELWPCLRVDLGIRSTGSSNIPGANTRVRPWLSVDALVHARFRLAPPLFLELGGGAIVPAWHDRVFLEPNMTVHQVPAVGFLGQMAVGIEFGDRNRN